MEEDGQGNAREVEFKDTEFTSICDWIDTCNYECAIKMETPIRVATADRSTYDEYAAKWHETELRNFIRRIFQENEQPMFRFEQLQAVMSAIPASALKSLLADIVGNQSFRIKVGKREGYIEYRNGFYLFQPYGIIDTQIPLALRIQDYPVKRDFFEAVIQKITRTEGVTKGIWPAALALASAVRAGEDITAPFALLNKGLAERYTNPAELVKEQQHIFGLTWFYETMKNDARYRALLADAFLGLVWDEILKPKEQLELVNDEMARNVGEEQILKKGTREVFRFIDGHTAEMRYLCGDKVCDLAVAKVFDTDAADPLNALSANVETTGFMYGFLVPNLKSGYLTFKTTDKPAAPGKSVPKGGECEIVTQIAFHFTALGKIGEALAAAGLPRFGLTPEEFKGPRKFQNSSRACSLLNVILRWMQMAKLGQRLWFFRPIAAYKTKHLVMANKPKKVRAKKAEVA
jgi:hypothetical protein